MRQRGTGLRENLLLRNHPVDESRFTDIFGGEEEPAAAETGEKVGDFRQVRRGRSEDTTHAYNSSN